MWVRDQLCSSTNLLVELIWVVTIILYMPWEPLADWAQLNSDFVKVKQMIMNHFPVVNQERFLVNHWRTLNSMQEIKYKAH